MADSNKDTLYTPLSAHAADPEIRLLELLPPRQCSRNAASDDTIHCTLTPTRLSSATHTYEALSYAWGPQSPLLPITLNLNTSSSPFSVGENLYAALKRLRYPDRSRVLWVDAICINQKDVEERNKQVGIMRGIYGGCRRVVVWLGEMDAEAEKGWGLVGRLGEVRRRRREREGRGEDEDEEEKEEDLIGYPLSIRGIFFSSTSTSEKTLLPNFYSSHWVAFTKLYTRSWFRRIWIVQELAVGPEVLVVCGTYEISWDELSRANAMMKTGSALADVLRVERNARQVLLLGKKKEGKEEDLAVLAVKHRARLASDARDMLFALCGLVRKEQCFGIVPDYKLGVQELFVGFTRGHIMQTGTLDILSARGVIPDEFRDIQEMPSWLYDGCYDLRYCPRRLLGWEAEDIIFCASKDTKCVLPLERDDPTKLTIRGFELDRISTLGMWSRGSDENLDDIHESSRRLLAQLLCYRDWYNLIVVTSKESKYAATHEPLPDVFWQTCSAGHPPNTFLACQSRFRKFHRAVTPFLRTTSCSSSSSTPSKTLARAGLANTLLRMTLLFFLGRFRIGDLEWLYDIADTIPNKRVLRTEGGYVGLAPITAQPGDLVGVFEGGKVPLVLREENKSGGWEFVGEAYVHGVMYGEKWDEGRERCMEFVLV